MTWNPVYNGDNVTLVKLNASGEQLWSRGLGGSEGFIMPPLDMAVDNTGRVVLGGSYINTVDFGGGERSGNSVLKVFMAWYGPDGAYLSDTVYTAQGEAGGHGEAYVYGIGLDGQGNAVLAGTLSGTVIIGGQPLTSQGGSDALLLKVDPTP